MQVSQTRATTSAPMPHWGYPSSTVTRRLVFSTLAQKAASIQPPQVVAGWLYQTTRHFAMHTLRAE